MNMCVYVRVCVCVQALRASVYNLSCMRFTCAGGRSNPQDSGPVGCAEPLPGQPSCQGERVCCVFVCVCVCVCVPACAICICGTKGSWPTNNTTPRTLPTCCSRASCVDHPRKPCPCVKVIAAKFCPRQ